MEHTTKWVFWACLVISVAMLIAGFIVPPPGIIDGSVLTAVGELFGFATLAAAIKISKYKQMELRHGNTTLTISEDDDENNDKV